MAKALGLPRLSASFYIVDVAPVLHLERNDVDFAEPQLWIWRSLIDRGILEGELEFDNAERRDNRPLAVLKNR